MQQSNISNDGDNANNNVSINGHADKILPASAGDNADRSASPLPIDAPNVTPEIVGFAEPAPQESLPARRRGLFRQRQQNTTPKRDDDNAPSSESS